MKKWFTRTLNNQIDKLAESDQFILLYKILYKQTKNGCK
jgi:hypothetical protein